MTKEEAIKRFQFDLEMGRFYSNQYANEKFIFVSGDPLYYNVIVDFLNSIGYRKCHIEFTNTSVLLINNDVKVYGMGSLWYLGSYYIVNHIPDYIIDYVKENMRGYLWLLKKLLKDLDLI